MGDSLVNVITSTDDDVGLFGLPPINMTHNSPGNLTSVGSQNDSAETPNIVAWVCGFFALFLMCYLMTPRVPPPSMRRALIAREERARRAAERKDPVKRKRVIHQSLITKRVMGCDPNGNLTLGDDADPDDGNLSDNEGVSLASDNEEEDSSVCVICLAPFRVGDTVTWSKEATECLHVFHHDCIMQWLENPKHDDCPSCRYHILQFDAKVGEEEEQSECGSAPGEDDDLQGQNIAFVIMNGLISRARQARSSLIGSSIEMEDCVPPPPVSLRKVVSEGPRLASVLRRVPSWRTAHPVHPHYDSISTDVESPFRRASLPEDDLRTIHLTRSISEGTIYESRSFEEPGLFSAGRVAFRKVSSGIYSRLSSTFDSADHEKSREYGDDENLEDEEDDIILRGNNIWRVASSGEINGGGEVDIETGGSPNRLVERTVSCDR